MHSLAALSISWDEVLGRLALAAALGGAIGIEREIREQEAGLRTHMLVSVGAALFTVVGAYGFQGQNVDPSRIAAQIVTGVGFLGAGAIIRRCFSVRGLTTAATLWVVAAVGLASGEAAMFGLRLRSDSCSIFDPSVSPRLYREASRSNSSSTACCLARGRGLSDSAKPRNAQ